ncbi:hypothetical protein [Nocardia jinanensis]|uniref:Uncharacterized protein n=1 Tax=Nocardia jinanensis TaxID=382504 RepID=A0A917W020_9NOCA|nr:hypothetical protein [Nocardia jinanensis]GGL44930.1 hypothetical protein GCM10011588_69490 [Nocardia jinanensis]
MLSWRRHLYLDDEDRRLIAARRRDYKAPLLRCLDPREYRLAVMVSTVKGGAHRPLRDPDAHGDH